MTTGRVIEVHRTNFTVTVGDKVLLATVRGDFHQTGDFPVVGDYVSLELLDDDKAVVESIVERKNIIRRRGAEDDEVQVIAANIDLIIIVMGLDGDFNLSRLERYLLLAEQSGIAPVIVLNKTDVALDLERQMAEAAVVAGEVPVYALSAKSGDGLEAVARHFGSDTTAVLLGSSGAGKSTITNWLLQENRQAVRDIRADDSRGRHTTTSRQLFALPNGGYLIDTPGMRELGVVDTDAADELAVFEHIEALATQCRFRDCDHEKSAGCAVLTAVASGELPEREHHNYHKLLRERAYHEDRDTIATRHATQNTKRTAQKLEIARRLRLLR